MDIITKKEILKYKVLNDYNYDLIIYRLIDLNILDKYIENIDDVSLSYKVCINRKRISSERFLILLNYFIGFFKKNLSNINNIEYLLIMIFKDNIYIDKYIKECSIDDKNNILIKKAIINNFVHNIDFIPYIKDMFKELNIEKKSLHSMTDNDVEVIFKLVMDIIFCNKHQGNISYLFINIKDELNSNYNSNHIELYLKYYKALINNYNKKKKYLKYFI